LAKPAPPQGEGCGFALPFEREQARDRFFAKGEITPERISTETTAITKLNGQLRAMHLVVYLETRALLEPEQLALYQQLRGYDGSNEHHRHLD
jgi:hypothetical protein